MNSLILIQKYYEDSYCAKTDWGKVEYIKELEWEDIDSKWDLYNTILLDEEDYDLARIEVLRILEVTEIPLSYQQKLSSSLAKVIETTSDEDVLTYAVICASVFITNPTIERLVIAVLLDISQDENIRYCAFDVILKIEDKEKRNNLLEQLIEDVLFTKSVKRLLAEE